MSFNPRSRVGSDDYPKLFCLCWYSFNPRSRVGSDWSISVCVRRMSMFQSTLPRRERHVRGLFRQADNFRFNPRSRVGSDEEYIVLFHRIVGFNPRSRVGSDHLILPLMPIMQCFNPRSRVGSDFNGLTCTQKDGACFNPRSRVGSDSNFAQIII